MSGAARRAITDRKRSTSSGDDFVNFGISGMCDLQLGSANLVHRVHGGAAGSTAAAEEPLQWQVPLPESVKLAPEAGTKANVQPSAASSKRMTPKASLLRTRLLAAMSRKP